MKLKEFIYKALIWLSSFFIAFLLIFFIRSSFMEPYQIPTGSMIPNLWVGDRLLSNKLKYGFRTPWTSLKSIRKNSTPPERGDIIIFRYPQNPNTLFIKRVIGLPGEELSIENKKILINENKLKTIEINKNKFIQFKNELEKEYNWNELKFFQEIYSEKNSAIILNANPNPIESRDWLNTVAIPKDHFFVLGDNRDYSNDSRNWGFVPKELILGSASFVLFSWYPTGESFFEKLFYRSYPRWIDLTHSQ